MNKQEDFERESLVEALVELGRALEPHQIPIIIGGGMGLFLSQICLEEKRQARYPKELLHRSTNDLDVFLTTELIADASKIENLKQVLKNLHYQAKTEAQYFQFTKEVSLYGQDREVKIDLLAPLPDDKENVRVSGIRIRPRGVREIHARVVREADGIEFGKKEVDLSRIDKNLPKQSNIFVPSRFNYLILKLHAFHDRKEDADVDYGRHHAYDIFSTVTSMTEEDWRIAKDHTREEKGAEYIKNAVGYRTNYFSKESDLGVIRLKENVMYQTNKMEYDKYINPFLEDLKELFS